MPHTPYKPIEDYGVIGNLRTTALVGRDGSIDWCCLPELDRPSVFAAILDHHKGGRFRVSAVGSEWGEQRYLDNTNILEISFATAKGRLTVTDFMPLYGSIIRADDPMTSPTLHRLLFCDEGEVEVVLEWSPRFDYARADTKMELTPNGATAWTDGERLALAGLPPGSAHLAQAEGPTLRAQFVLKEGEHLPLITRYGVERLRVELGTVLEALEATTKAWRGWVHSCDDNPGGCAFGGSWHALTVRSALLLKLLTHPDTGAIAAAPTTSLPEEIGGVRNWDYRYAWIRDASFTVQALFSMGHHAEALDFVAWAERVASRGGEALLDLQIMYGLRGETSLPERELSHLEGYRGSKPVRIGNGAAKQRQLDIYGELIGAAYECVRLGGHLDAALMHFLGALADRACEVWREPDYGIWEVRGGPRHFVYSKVMIWVALDRALCMAERFGLQGDVEKWQRERDAVHRAVCEEGYDAEVGAFVQSFGSRSLDAANLLMPIVEFLPFDDPRIQSTIDRILEELTEGGVVYRYHTEDGKDGLPGGEGAFGLTTFWMVDALALSGRVDEAHEMFEGMVRRANHLGLYAEEFDPTTGAFLGNFPQGFSHIGFINSALYLARVAGRHVPAPAPVGSEAHAQEAGREKHAAG